MESNRFLRGSLINMKFKKIRTDYFERKGSHFFITPHSQRRRYHMSVIHVDVSTDRDREREAVNLQNKIDISLEQ